MEPGGSLPHSQGLSNNPYPEQINPITRIDTYFFNIHSNIFIPHLRLGIPKGHFPACVPHKTFKAPYFLSFWLHDLPISVS